MQPQAAIEAQIGPGSAATPSAASVTKPSDDRSVLATAYEWASRIIVVSLEMVLPGMAGYWVDTRLGTICLFMVIGLTVGSVVAIRHLIKVASDSSKKR